MCVCITSTLSPYPGIGVLKLGFTTFNCRLTTAPLRTAFTFRNGELRRVSHGLQSSGTKSIKVSRNSSVFQSDEYEVHSESGLKEKEKRQTQFETSEEETKNSNSTMRNDVDRTKVEDSGPALSSVDFLEYNDKNGTKKAMGRSKDGDDLVRIEGSDSDGVGVGSKLKELESRNSGSVLRTSGRRQLIRRSNIIAKQVISMQSALSLGFVSQLWLDTNSWMVLVVEVRPNLLSGEIERFLLQDVGQVGDVVLIQDESVMENEFKMVGLETMVGYNVVTTGLQNIGKVRGYTFNINTGAVELLELDSFGISIIPSSLVSTYALFVEDVVEVVSDTVIVHEAAASRIQRLTKGFWDARNAGNATNELGEYPDLERQPIQSDHGWSRRRSYTSRKFHTKRRDAADDWELPMDYL